ncbi:hypothetical protein TEA_025100 [Camellia sinensis var. sinensis]|uniref:Uncharacterized protein n=1 Tax=Camellia sinensis var. sinensis TaxID=542762 RepID=A0A4S4EF05_CAMSN|nr:hypothetical protein TEA_025100 [Camellia sinensis var. sinensis]
MEVNAKHFYDQWETSLFRATRAAERERGAQRRPPPHEFSRRRLLFTIAITGIAVLLDLNTGYFGKIDGGVERFHGGEEVGDDGFVGGGNDFVPDGDAVDFGGGVERRMLLATQDTAAESLETAGMSELATVTVT